MIRELKQELRYLAEVKNHKPILKAMEKVTEITETMKKPAIMMDRKILTDRPIKS